MTNAEAERIAAFIHIADGDDLMLSSDPAVQRKLYAVRCVIGHKAAELLEAVDDAELFIASLRPENVGSALHANLNDELQAAQHAYRVHVADADVIEEWLAREDPALYAAAKKARGCNTSGCGCHSYDRYEASMREWIDSLSQTKA